MIVISVLPKMPESSVLLLLISATVSLVLSSPPRPACRQNLAPRSIAERVLYRLAVCCRSAARSMTAKHVGRGSCRNIVAEVTAALWRAPAL